MALTHTGPGALITPRFAEPSLKEGKAPPGWEGPIQKMKKSGTVKNPWALSWYMKKRGATPGGKRMDAMGHTSLSADDEQHILVESQAFDASLAAGTLPLVYLAAAKGEAWAEAVLLGDYPIR